jgi:long-chain acyl-CoA synthetase
MLSARTRESPDAVAYRSLDCKQTWQPTHWTEHLRVVTALAGAFRELGLTKGDRLAIMAPSCLGWETAQMAALCCGATVLGVDAHDQTERLSDILDLTKPAAMVVGDDSLVARLPARSRTSLRFIVSIEKPHDSAPGSRPLWIQELVSRGSGQNRDWQSDACPDDQAVVVFTSGTTGSPKGIAYTHAQVCLGVRSILAAYSDIAPDSRLVCWLPLSNLFQRMVNLCAVAHGSSTYFVSDPREIVQHLPSINPHVFVGVPRFFEKLHAGILSEVGRRAPWQRRLIAGALRLGEEVARARHVGHRPSTWTRLAHRVADALVLARLRSVMGTSLKYVVSGSAPMPPWLLDEFDALGLPVLEAYGLSENIVPVAANTVRHARRGTVGQPLPGNEITLGEDGELKVRGPGVFARYYAVCEQRADPPAGDCLATGDYAEIDADGFITLTGRKSEVFKTSNGRRIAPARIEGRLRHIAYVEHAVVLGASRPYLVALLVLSANQLVAAMGARYMASSTDLSQVVLIKIATDVEREVTALTSYERPAGLVVTLEPLTIEGGELTANLKVRRDIVAERFGDAIERLYSTLDARDAKGAGHNVLVQTT